MTIPFDEEKESTRIINFIKTTIQNTGFTDVVIGLSGGIDSAVVCALTVRALGPDHVFPMLLPCGALNTQGVLDAMKVIEFLHLPLSHVIRIDIKQVAEMMTKLDPTTDNIRKGNIMARVRMIYLFDQAKKRKALVVGTENKTEHLLGYYTRFGDEASDIEPIRHIYKTQIFTLAKYLHVPSEIQTKKPSADLWPGQTDEGEFGFTYREADEVLYLFVDQRKIKEEITKTISPEIVNNVLLRMEKNKFKSRIPYAIDMI